MGLNEAWGREQVGHKVLDYIAYLDFCGGFLYWANGGGGSDSKRDWYKVFLGLSLFILLTGLLYAG